VEPYVGLTLLAALLFAVGNALQKQGIASRLRPLSAVTLARKPVEVVQALLRQPLWLLGLVVTVVAVGFETQALSLGDVSVVKPLSQVQSIFVVLIGVCLLRERVRATEWLAVAVLTAGVGMLAQQPGDSAISAAGRLATLVATVAIAFAAGLSLFAMDRVAAGAARELGPALASGSLFGMGDVVMKVGTEVARERTGHFDLSRSGTIETLLGTPEFHLALVLGLAAFLVQQLAFSRGRLSLVAPVVTVGATAVAVLVGSVLLGESMDRARLSGIGAVLLGTLLLAPGAGAEDVPAAQLRKRRNGTRESAARSAPPAKSPR
jgi:drug/metabolite transporter (DMT)-like permease